MTINKKTSLEELAGIVAQKLQEHQLDCVKDRLASYYYWEDRQALDQAIMVCAKRKVDLKNIEAWSKAEGHLEKYQHFVTFLK